MEDLFPLRLQIIMILPSQAYIRMDLPTLNLKLNIMMWKETKRQKFLFLNVYFMFFWCLRRIQTNECYYNR